MLSNTAKITEVGAEIRFHEHHKKFGFLSSVSDCDIRAWSKASGSSASLALAELEQLQDQYSEEIVESGNTFALSHNALAMLSGNTLKALGLPKIPTYTFELSMVGNLGSNEFSLKPQWSRGAEIVSVQRNGAILKTTDGDYVIPDPIYSVLNEIEAYNKSPSTEVDERTAFAAKILNYFDISTVDDVTSESANKDSVTTKLNGVLSNFRVKTANSLSLSINRKFDGISITPVLFSKDDLSGDEEVSEEAALLSNSERLTFEHDPRRGFFAFERAKSTYLLPNGEYLLIDADLAPALKYVRELREQPAEQREEFAANPAKSLTEIYRQYRTGNDKFSGLNDDLQEEEIDHLVTSIFLETKEYSERVLGLGLWVPPVLPYLEKAPNAWEPESFGLKIGDEFVPLTKDQINPLKEKITKAINKGEKTILWQGKPLPADSETLEVLIYIGGLVEPAKKGEASGNRTNPGAGDQQVLLVKDNFEDLNYYQKLSPRKLNTTEKITDNIRSTLQPHQVVSFNWQIDAFREGLPGILNADDQGLGKTLQSIAFMAWLQKNMKNGPEAEMKPILVVAPTSLLKNWGNEVQIHMDSQGLGPRIDAYGNGAASLFVKPLEDGGFDFQRGGSKNLCWILTTYTTFANNHIDFAKIDFAAAIFDEIQYLKNPSSFRNRAAQSVNADFVLGLTGTPIENALSDLWAITDTLVPGYFGSLKDFTKRYSEASNEEYKELNDKVFQAGYHKEADGKEMPAIGIRRMKTDSIEGLPAKNYRFYANIMPSEQAAAYHSVFLTLDRDDRGRALKMLHQLRSVSLYPDRFELIEQEEDGLAVLMNKSARITQAVEILDRLRDRKEKALIFLETRKLQYVLQRLLAQRYGFDRINIINGETSAKRRDEIVRGFQAGLKEDPKFDLLILGPKAAGVGLTLTAATHVIHLSRWWNPAVEEQCNDRVYRIGQDQNVTVHIPLSIHPDYMENSFDCILNDIMIRKRTLFQDVLMPPVDADGGVGAMIDGLCGEKNFSVQKIDEMTWRQFEDWVMQAARNTRQWTPNSTPRTGDGGCDALLVHRERPETVIVQAKHTDDRERKISVDALHETLNARTRYNAPNARLVVITNARGFTGSAETLARENDIVLVDRTKLSLWPKNII